MGETFLATIGIPSARQCLMVAAPFAALWGLRWLYLHLDEIIAGLFPHWAWEKKLGWLNLRAHRRADAILRGLLHLVHAGLAVALYGIVWSAAGISAFWDNPEAIAQGAWKISVLLVCLGFWSVYLGCDLIPKLRQEHEREELEKFRATEMSPEDYREPSPPRRKKGPLLKPSSSTRSQSRRN